MPFGLKNAGAHFCRVMQQSFGALASRGLFQFIDDVLGATFTFEDLCLLLVDLFQLAIQLGIKFNPSKCQFLKTYLLFLGHLITPEGVLPDPEKTKSIKLLPAPQTPTAVRSFLGMANFYKRFIPAYSEIALPLFSLTQGSKKKRIVWEHQHQQAFEELKNALTMPPCLMHPDFTRDFHLVVYGNSRGVGAVLEQQPDGGTDRRPVAFYSAKLSGPQQRYSQCQLECLAIVLAVEHFRVYLEGKRFHLYVRQASLTWLFRETPLKPILARWVLRLQAYDFVIHNVKGSQNPAEAHAQAMLPEGAGVTQEAPPVVIHQVALKTEPLDMSTLKKQQEEDPLWSRFLEMIATDASSRPSYVTDQRGLLYKRDGAKVRLCVPLGSRKAILEQFHDSIWGAHWGTNKMVAAVSDRFFWPGLRKDIEEHVGSCLHCLMRKPAPTLRPPLQLANAETEKAGAWSVDLVGPLPITKRGNRYILTALDTFTRFPEACALPNQKATTVITGLVEIIISRYGHITKIISDQGRQFTSGVFAQVCAMLGVKHITTSAYNPRANMVESMHRSLGDFLSIFTCGDLDRDWDELLPYALLALRASKHASTGFSPAMLMTGRQAAMPWDALVEPEIAYGRELQLSHHEDLELMKADLIMAKEEAHRRDMESKLRTHEKGEQRPLVLLTEGDLVLIRNLGPRAKFDPRWKGPCRVLRRLSDVTYELEHTTTNSVIRFNASHLRELRREPRSKRVYIAGGGVLPPPPENSRPPKAPTPQAAPPSTLAPPPPPLPPSSPPPSSSPPPTPAPTSVLLPTPPTTSAGPASHTGAIRKQPQSRIPKAARGRPKKAEIRPARPETSQAASESEPAATKPKTRKAKIMVSARELSSPARRENEGHYGLREHTRPPKRYRNNQ